MGTHTHPVRVSKNSYASDLCSTYDSNFATELVLDFARLDCIGRVLLDELVQVFDTHFSKL
jgi:hypothetical protein